jgi:WD40 repeat protein
MKAKLLLVLTLIFGISSVAAQNTGLPDLETISGENVERIQELTRWQSDSAGFVAATFSPDGRTLALALNDGFIRLLNLPSLELERTLSGANFEGALLRYSPDGTRLMLSHWNGTHRFWDIERGELLNAHLPHSDEIWSEADPPLRNLIVLSADQTVAVSELDSGKERIRIGPVNPTPRPQLSAGGLLAAAVETTIFVWDTTAGELLYRFTPPIDGELTGLGFNPDGTVLWANWRDWLLGRNSSENQSVIQFWDTTTGSELFRLNGGGAHYRMYFDPTGKKVATAGENDNLNSTVWVWNLETKQLIGEAGVPTGGGLAGFNPDGQLLAIASGSAPRIHIWDATEPETPIKVALDVGSGSAVPPQFSPDRHLLLTIGTDIRLWGVLASKGVP